MKKSLWKNSLWIFFVIITALLVPSTISRHAQTEDRSVVIAVGIDKLDTKSYELTAEIIVPRYETTYNQNAQIISAKGRNTSEAFANLSLEVGRIIGLSHCSAVVIGESMKDENIIPLVDEFLRSKRANYNAQLIYSRSKARDVLQKAIEIDNGFNQNINEIVQFNDKFINAETMLLSDFYKTYYQGYGANLVSVISLLDEDYNGLSAENSGSGGGGDSPQNAQSSKQDSSGQESGGQESSGGEQERSSQSGQQAKQGQYFSNIGESAIFHKGKLVRILSPEEVTGFGLLNNRSKRGAIIVDDVEDDLLSHAQLTFSIRSRTGARTIDFSPTGTPRVHYSLTLATRLEQISDNNLTAWQVTSDMHEFLTPKVKSKLSDTLKSQCAQAINIAKETNMDLFNIYRDFDRYYHQQWQEYLKSLDESASYTENVEFFVDFVINDVD